MPQNSWPIVEIRMTAFAPSTLSAEVRMGSTEPAPVSAVSARFVTANVIASSTM